jgi:hypothetical protein
MAEKNEQKGEPGLARADRVSLCSSDRSQRRHEDGDVLLRRSTICVG